MEKTREQAIAELNAQYDEKERIKKEREERRERERKEMEAFENRLVANAVLWYNFTEEQARKIFVRAWQDGHSYGYHEVENHFDDLCEFVVDILKINV